MRRFLSFIIFSLHLIDVSGQCTTPSYSTRESVCAKSCGYSGTGSGSYACWKKGYSNSYGDCTKCNDGYMKCDKNYYDGCEVSPPPLPNRKNPQKLLCTAHHHLTPTHSLLSLFFVSNSLFFRNVQQAGIKIKRHSRHPAKAAP